MNRRLLTICVAFTAASLLTCLCLALPAFAQVPAPTPAPGPSLAQFFTYMMIAALAVGCVGGLLERIGQRNTNGLAYRIGNVLAGLGSDLFSVVSAFRPSAPGGGGGGTRIAAPVFDIKTPSGPTPPAVARGRLAGLVLVAGVLLVAVGGIGANCSGTIDPKTQNEITTATQLGVCIEDTYANDSQKVPKPGYLQIAIDIGATCGADVPVLVNAFGSKTDADHVAVVNAAKADPAAMHAAAASFKRGH